MTEKVFNESAKEIAIRGQFLSIFASIESALSTILLITLVDEVIATQKDQMVKFNGLKIGQKIDLVCERLTTHHKKVYNNNQQVFDDLKCLLKFRHQLAHNGITWDKTDKSFMIVWVVDIDEGTSYHKGVRYPLIEVDRKIEEANKILKRLNELMPLIAANFMQFLQEVLRNQHQ